MASHYFSRRTLLGMAVSAGVVSTRSRSAAQTQSTSRAATVSLIHGEIRRKNVTEALAAIDEQILPVLKTRKYVVIKPNLVSTVNPLAATNADTLLGIMDYLAPRFKGPVIVAESSAGNTPEGFDNFKYQSVVNEFKTRHISLLDLNQEGKYVICPVVDQDLHPTPVRLAAR